MGTILSILGTVLLLLLKIVLILLLLLLVLLLLPIHYKVLAEYQEKLSLQGHVTWLAAIVFLRVSYQEDSPKVVLRIFGLDIQKFLAGREERRKKKAAKKRSKQKEIQKDRKEANQEEQEKIQKTTSQTEKKEAAENTDTAKEEKLSGHKKTSRIRASFQNMVRLFRSIRKKAEWGNLFKEFWQQENTKRMVCILKDNVVHLWRKLKPRVVRGRVEFGTGDPCLTGELLGAAALFYAYYGKGVTVIPDFEEARLAGTLLIKGHISLITIVFILIRIFMNGEWSEWKHDIDQLKEAL